MGPKAVVMQYYAEFDRSNVDLLEAMLAPDFRAYLPGEAAPLRRSDFKHFAKMFLKAFPNVQHQFELVLVDDEQVVTRGYFTGTHCGRFQGLPATGQTVKVDFIHIDRVNNGQLVEHWGQADLAAMFQQLGIAPIPLRAMARAISHHFSRSTPT